MRSTIITLPILLITSVMTLAQQPVPSRLKIFIDCPNTWCDMQHIRTEINVVDFLLDNAASDVHMLITSQGTGSGGREYNLIFFGQQFFKNQTDTLSFHISPDATEFEERDLLLKYIKTGLIPFIAKTEAINSIVINLKSSDSTETGTDSLLINDPWNAWVINTGAGGNLSADANYRNKSYNARLSANRITDKLKIGFGISGSKNRSEFAFEDEGVTEKFVVNNHNWSVNQYMVKSLGSHWSAAYELKYIQNTFSNTKGRAFLHVAAEYNVFPYTDVNHKLFTLSYGLTARRNQYYDTTIYNKTQETLLGHRATAHLSFNQKWGNAYAGFTYHNYFNNWKFYNLGVDVYTSVRVTGGLSFYILAFGGLTRDQVSLLKGNATPEEVLARRRQLASGYTYYTSFGFNYRFGSKLNNVVNPRFDRSSAQFVD